MGVYRFVFYLKIISRFLFYYYDSGTSARIIRVASCSEDYHYLRKHIEVISEFEMSLIIIYGLICILYYVYIVRFTIIQLFSEYTIQYHIRKVPGKRHI